MGYCTSRMERIMIRTYLIKQIELLIVYLQRRADIQVEEKKISDDTFKIVTFRLNEALGLLTDIIKTLTS